MKILWIIVLFGFLAAAVEAKRKRKFEGDFEFAEEVSSVRILLQLYESRVRNFIIRVSRIKILSGFGFCCMVNFGHSVSSHYSHREMISVSFFELFYIT
jgi:uncharacterized protein (UPF0128 family)